MDLFEKVREIIVQSLGCEASRVMENTDIKEDLEADSLAIVELIMSIEDGFGIIIDESEAENAKTVADIIKIVAEKTQ